MLAQARQDVVEDTAADQDRGGHAATPGSG
jgi:hypothetical protein